MGNATTTIRQDLTRGSIPRHLVRLAAPAVLSSLLHNLYSINDLLFAGFFVGKDAQAAVGAVRGGLGIVNVFSSMLFGGISGSAVADISALGSLLVPVMKERGYRPDFAVNVTVTSSIAGIVIPPSHNMIIFAVAAGGGGDLGGDHGRELYRLCDRALRRTTASPALARSG